VLARLAAGEAVDPASYYFRATPAFEAPPGPHAWMMHTVFIATGERAPDHVVSGSSRCLRARSAQTPVPRIAFVEAWPLDPTDKTLVFSSSHRRTRLGLSGPRKSPRRQLL
jgi:hypothetical protein